MSSMKREAADEFDEFDDIDDADFLSEATALEAATNLHAKRQKYDLGHDLRLLDLLQNTFGIQSFRLAQEAAITRLVNGESAVVVFPTGGGKSLCYQLTALAIDGLTIVVSPLIALMKDQTESLKRRGVAADSIDSSKSRDEYCSAMELVRSGKMKILFVAPERLNNEGFMDTIMSLKSGVALIAIDEAHCISEWGHAFRPDYLKVARFVQEVGVKRVVCLTATATPQVASDICKVFGVEDAGLFRTSSFRPNLQLLVEAIGANQKQGRLVGFLRKHAGASIVYVTAQKQAEELALYLATVGFTTNAYHAGMDTKKRNIAQENFMKVDNIVIVATIAFGMGIDKADIRNVVHYDIPRSLEGYSQEIGRAGRDGKPSTCLLFLCGEDFIRRENIARGDLSSLHSVQRLLLEFFSGNFAAPAGTVLEAKKYTQSRDWDIRDTTLGNIYAQLELRCGLIREITPRYGSYTYKPIRPSYMNADGSQEAKAILLFSTQKASWTHIDVATAAAQSATDRNMLVRKLQQWNDSGAIELKASAVVHRFRVLKTLPTTKKEIDAIAESCYTFLNQRETEEIARYKAVVAFATASTCLAARLATYFGDSIPNGVCNNCTICITRKAVKFIPAQKQPVDLRGLNAIIKMCGDQDDPRLIARVAFGISSPRITTLRLSRLDVFGSIGNCDFEELLEACTKCLNLKKSQ